MIDQNTKIIMSYRELEFHDNQIRAETLKEYMLKDCDSCEAHLREEIRAEVIDEVLTIINNHHFDNDKGDFDMLIHNLCKEVKLFKEQNK